MDFIKTTQRIQNKRVIVNIPEDFISENVEVIILPLLTDDNNFTQEITKVSEKSFQEWDNKEDEIYDTL